MYIVSQGSTSSCGRQEDSPPKPKEGFYRSESAPRRGWAFLPGWVSPSSVSFLHSRSNSRKQSVEEREGEKSTCRKTNWRTQTGGIHLS